MPKYWLPACSADLLIKFVRAHRLRRLLFISNLWFSQQQAGSPVVQAVLVSQQQADILLYQTRLWVQIDRIGVPAWDIDGLVHATRYRTNTFVTTFSPVLTEQERVITKQSHCR